MDSVSEKVSRASARIAMLAGWINANRVNLVLRCFPRHQWILFSIMPESCPGDYPHLSAFSANVATVSGRKKIIGLAQHNPLP
jgi:hypothetical protein